MSKVCSICQRGSMSGNKVSHSNRKSRRIWNVNLQKIHVKGIQGKTYVCTNCLKSGRIERA
ncbi:MAG: 50S ribosomal protein L28 [Clostridiales bacterium]|jgi:large subunit ribosomal protein L28|nr:50S ribosomal protein L28 [Clostridiales bacterium]